MGTLLHSLGAELTLAVVAGFGAALALVQLLRARRRARRVRDLAGRAASLGAPTVILSGGDHASAADEIGALTAALESAEGRLAEERAIRDRQQARALEEVRRPLTLLATSLDLALRRRPEVPELSAALRDAQREAERIARLAGRITQLQSAAAEVKRTPVDIASLAQAAWQLRQAAFAQKGVSLTLDAPGPAQVQGDRALLAQAIDELVSNALAVSRFGTGVVIAVARDGAAVRLTVRDEGPGFPAERRSHAFEPFQRGNGGFGQAGLGLALVREIARGHGGTVALGEVPRGAAVVLELPAG